MLAIRMQRTGRKGHAQFRVIVQDSRRTPTSGKIVALLGHYDPHTKVSVLKKDRASFYLEHGAQPSERVTRLLKAEGVKLPKWIAMPEQKKGAVKNPDKLRKNRPAAAEAPVGKPADTPQEDQSSESAATDQTEAPVEDKALLDINTESEADQPSSQAAENEEADKITAVEATDENKSTSAKEA